MVQEHTLCELNPFIFTETYFMTLTIALNTVDVLLFQGLCLCCALRLECSSPRLPPDLFPQPLWVSVQMSSSLWGLPWPLNVKCTYALQQILFTLLSWFRSLYCTWCVCVCLNVFSVLEHKFHESWNLCLLYSLMYSQHLGQCQAHKYYVLYKC